ncbi:MAG: amidohydrolase family protein [Parvularcula sp.]|jgi:predicted TIM-barrel fold metal-dependent hydrolase|nr:amidohydrolase family protein [Parvularcula sp.]
MIDTQAHLLDPDSHPYPATTQGYRPSDAENGRMADLLREMESANVSRAILVQASVYGVDNAAILDAVAADPARFRAVVMTEENDVPGIAAVPGVVGVRLNMTDYGGHGGVQDVRRVAAGILDHGFILQLQATPEDAKALLDALPPGPVILDHFCRVDLTRPGDLKTVARLAERDDCYLKVSGAFRLTGLEDWRTPDARLKALCAAYGANRVLWGSDWPFIKLGVPRPTYRDTIGAAGQLIDLNQASANAERLFGWSDG